MSIPHTTGSEVIPTISIEAVIQRRQRALELATAIEEAHNELSEMGGSYRGDKGYAEAGIICPSMVLDSHRMSRAKVTVANIMKVVDAGLWDWMMKRSGLWTFMDATARKQWEDQIDKFDFPDMTPENIEQTFEAVHSQRADMVGRGIDELFQRLSRNHKTNRPQGFTPKIIMTYVASVWGHSSGRTISAGHRTTDELDDLNRVLHILRGIPQPEHQQSNSHQRISDAINKRRENDGKMLADFPFFTVRVFLNGNGHLTFKDPEDIKRLNAMLSVRYGGLRIAQAR